MMTSIERAFPNRAVRIVAPGFSLGFLFLLSAILPLPIAIGLLMLPIDEIRRDYFINRNPTFISGAEICAIDCAPEESGPQERLQCAMEVRFVHDGRPHQQMLAGRSVGEPGPCRQGSITIAADRPEYVSLAHDYRSSLRTSALRLILGVSLLSFCLVMLMQAVPILLARRAAGRRYLLKPVIVDVSGKRVLRYIPGSPFAPHATKTAYTRMAPKQAPLYIRSQGDRSALPTEAFAGHPYPALAVIAEGVPLPILLDRELTRLELSEPERNRIRVGIDEAIGLPSGETATPAYIRQRLIQPFLGHKPFNRPWWLQKWALRFAVTIPPFLLATIWFIVLQIL